MSDGWVRPKDPKPAEYILSCRSADAAPGYGGGCRDRHEIYRWDGRDNWVTGYRNDRQGRLEPELCGLQSGAGWRIVGPVPEWQPIATAPTDGTRVLVWAAPTTAGWDDPAMHLPGIVTIAAYHHDGGWCVDELREVTHWQPVPEGPK